MERMAAKVFATGAFMVIAIAVLVGSIDATTDDGGWENARATFYGDDKGNETMQGACGYGDLNKQGYGLETAALSSALFNNGATCGACYEIMCRDSKWCLKNTIHVTATNFCPANYTKKTDIWCNPPQKHFDLSLPMFRKIAVYEAGVVPVAYRRVPCIKHGGIMFEMKGKPPGWICVLVYNVGGTGQAVNVKVKGSKTSWCQMKRNWGQIWDVTDVSLVGQSLSFQVTTSDGKMLEFDDVVPASWKVNQTFEGKKQFTPVEVIH